MGPGGGQGTAAVRKEEGGRGTNGKEGEGDKRGWGTALGGGADTLDWKGIISVRRGTAGRVRWTRAPLRDAGERGPRGRVRVAEACSGREFGVFPRGDANRKRGEGLQKGRKRGRFKVQIFKKVCLACFSQKRGLQIFETRFV